MTIDRRAPLSGLKETSAVAEAGKPEFLRAVELARQAPEVRADRVVELKARIAETGWIDATLAAGVPDSLVDAVLG